MALRDQHRIGIGLAFAATVTLIFVMAVATSVISRVAVLEAFVPIGVPDGATRRRIRFRGYGKSHGANRRWRSMSRSNSFGISAARSGRGAEGAAPAPTAPAPTTPAPTTQAPTPTAKAVPPAPRSHPSDGLTDFNNDEKWYATKNWFTGDVQDYLNGEENDTLVRCS